jgi:outer membrane protein assembly factor BamB
VVATATDVRYARLGHGDRGVLVQLKKDWTFKLRGHRNVRARRPVVDGDRAYYVFTYDKGDFFGSVLLAFERTGREIWRVGADHVMNSPTLAEDGSVIVSDMGGTVQAVNPDGAVLWATALSMEHGNLGPPLVVQSRVVCAELNSSSDLGHTWGLRVQDGAIDWCAENAGHAYQAAARSNLVVLSSRSSEDSSWVQAIDARSGQVLWREEQTDYLLGTAIDDRFAYVQSHRGIMLFDLAGGAPAGTIEVSDMVEGAMRSPLEIDGRVYFWAESGKVCMAERASDRPRVRWMDACEETLLDLNSVGAGNVAALTTAGTICVWNAEGTRIVERAQLLPKGSSGGLCHGGDRLFASLGREAVTAQVAP